MRKGQTNFTGVSAAMDLSMGNGDLPAGGSGHGSMRGQYVSV